MMRGLIEGLRTLTCTLLRVTDPSLTSFTTLNGSHYDIITTKGFSIITNPR